MRSSRQRRADATLPGDALEAGALALLALRHVGADRAGLDGPSGGVGQREGDGRVRARLAVAHEDGLVVDRLLQRGGLEVVLAQLLGDLREQVGAQATLELVRREAEDAGALGVGHQVATVEVLDPDDRRRVVDHRAQSPLAVAARAFGLDAVGDVVADADERGRQAVRAGDHPALGEEHALVAAGADDALPEGEGLERPQRVLDVRPDPVAVVRMQVGDEGVDGSAEGARRDVVDAVELLRPPHAAGRDLPAPDAEPRDALGLGHAVGVLAHLGLRAAAFGDVAEDDDEVVAARQDPALEPALGRAGEVRQRRRLAPGGRPIAGDAKALADRGGQLGPQRPAEQQVARAGEQRRGRLVGVPAPPVGAEHDDPVLEPVEQRDDPVGRQPGLTRRSEFGGATQAWVGEVLSHDVPCSVRLQQACVATARAIRLRGRRRPSLRSLARLAASPS